MTISKTPRHDYRLGGRFAKQHPPADAFPDVAMQEAARIQRAMSTDMPVMPTDEPVERQDWGPVVNWRSLAIGLVAIAVCVAVYVAVPA